MWVSLVVLEVIGLLGLIVCLATQQWQRMRLQFFLFVEFLKWKSRFFFNFFELLVFMDLKVVLRAIESVSRLNRRDKQHTLHGI